MTNVGTNAIVVDDNHAPLFVVRFSARPTAAEFETYLQTLDDVLERNDRYALMFVTAPGAKMPSHRHALRQASWISERKQRIQARNAGVAFVLPSPLMRGFLRAVLAITPMHTQHEVFREEDDGLGWARGQLAAALPN